MAQKSLLFYSLYFFVDKRKQKKKEKNTMPWAMNSVSVNPAIEIIRKKESKTVSFLLIPRNNNAPKASKYTNKRVAPPINSNSR